ARGRASHRRRSAKEHRSDGPEACRGRPITRRLARAVRAGSCGVASSRSGSDGGTRRVGGPGEAPREAKEGRQGATGTRGETRSGVPSRGGVRPARTYRRGCAVLESALLHRRRVARALGDRAAHQGRAAPRAGQQPPLTGSSLARRLLTGCLIIPSGTAFLLTSPTVRRYGSRTAPEEQRLRGPRQEITRSQPPVRRAQ